MTELIEQAKQTASDILDTVEYRIYREIEKGPLPKSYVFEIHAQLQRLAMQSWEDKGFDHYQEENRVLDESLLGDLAKTHEPQVKKALVSLMIDVVRTNVFQQIENGQAQYFLKMTWHTFSIVQEVLDVVATEMYRQGKMKFN